MIAALILADGPVDGLGEQWLALRGAGLDPLRIAVGKDALAAAQASGLAGENFVVDRSRSATPVSALRAGLRALLAADDWDAVVVQPVSAPPPHPSVVLALLARLAEGDAGAVRPVHGGGRGFPVVLARDAAEAIVAARGGGSLDGLLDTLEEAGALEPLEVHTADVLPRRGAGRGKRS